MIHSSEFILLAGLLLNTLSGAAGPQSDTLLLSLDECIDQALQQNLQVQQSALEIEAAQIDLHEAKNRLLPNLAGVSRYNFNVGRSVNPVTNDFTDQPVRSQDYGLSAGLTLYDGWRNVRAIQQGKSALQRAGYSLAASRREIVLTVIQSYLEVLTRRALWKEAEQRIEETNQELKHTERLVAVGEVPPPNLTQLKLQRSEEQLTAVRYRNDYQLAQVQLRQLLFLPVSQLFHLQTPTHEQESLRDLVSLEALYSRAQTIDPAIKGAAVDQKMAQRTVKIAQGGYLPTVQLTLGGYSSYSDNPPPFLETLSYSGQLDFNLRKFVGFELTLPIYNRGRVKADVQRARVDLQRADLSQLQTQQRLWETLETAYRNTQSARDEYQAAQEREAAAEEAFASASVQFELGVMDVVSYSQVKSQRNEATAFRIQAKYRALFFEKILTFYQEATIQ